MSSKCSEQYNATFNSIKFGDSNFQFSHMNKDLLSDLVKIQKQNDIEIYLNILPTDLQTNITSCLLCYGLPKTLLSLYP